MKLFALYVHWPYCLSKCPYCDFASKVCSKIDEKSLLDRYIKDLEVLPKPACITSLYFGGGTPSLMSPSFFEQLMKAISARFSFASDIEVSLEVNPDAIDLPKMRFFRKSGVNRFSLGVQSLTQSGLHLLGRKHSVQTALQRIHEAQEVFQNINIDLIYGRPHQTCPAWEKELKQALSLNLPHYSLYQLTLEQGTPLFNQFLKMPSDNQLRRLYILTNQIMQQAGKGAYEVSNYAQKGFECRHNMTYWTGKDYAGIGPSACGRIDGYATTNARWVNEWLKTPMQWEKLTEKERQTEKIIMGFRLFHQGFPQKELPEIGVQQALKNKWITIKNDLVYPTQEGILMLNQLLLLMI